MINYFAKALTKAWHKESSKSRFTEVQQFRALKRSFESLKGSYKIEEFHGMKHQVIFKGKGSWGRNPARCEISDLLIITYQKKSGFSARATFLQAKRSTATHKDLCKYWPKSSAPVKFKANLEQWDLLSRRPRVLGHSSFKCHPEILSGAILPSIGSIGVFHKIGLNHYDFFYLSADIANPLSSSPKQKHASLQVKSINNARIKKGYKERLFACCITTFANSLYDMEIGTPIHDEVGITNKDKQYRNIFRGWLKSVITSHLEPNTSDNPISSELIENLESDYTEFSMKNPPELLIINSDTDEPDRRY